MLLHCIVHQQNCTNIFSNNLSENQDKANFDKPKSLQQLNDQFYYKNYLFLPQSTKYLL